MKIVSISKLRVISSSVSTNHTTTGPIGSELLILLFSQAPLVLLLPPHVFQLIAAIHLMSRQFSREVTVCLLPGKANARHTGAQIPDWGYKEISHLH